MSGKCSQSRSVLFILEISSSLIVLSGRWENLFFFFPSQSKVLVLHFLRSEFRITVTKGEFFQAIYCFCHTVVTCLQVMMDRYLQHTV